MTTHRLSCLRTAIILAAALAAAPRALAVAASGSTSFSITLQPVTLLYYYSSVNVTIGAATLLSLAGGQATAMAAQSLTATSAGSSLSATLAPANVPAATPLRTVQLSLADFWAERSITTPTSGSTTVTVSFSSTSPLTTASLQSAGAGSTIALSALATSSGTSTGTGVNGAPVYGTVSMDLDLSGATQAAQYSGATIYITATST